MAFEKGKAANPAGRPKDPHKNDTPQELRSILKKLKTAAPKGIQHLVDSMEKVDPVTGEVVADLKIAEKIFQMYLQALSAQEKILARTEVKDVDSATRPAAPPKKAEVSFTVVRTDGKDKVA